MQDSSEQDTKKLNSMASVTSVSTKRRNRKMGVFMSPDMIVKFQRKMGEGLSLAVAFFITGHGFAKFSSCISKNPYYETIKLVYPNVTDILNEMRKEEKE